MALTALLVAVFGGEVSARHQALSEEESVTAAELSRLVAAASPPLILDARSKRSYDAGHIRGAVLPRSGEYYRSAELFSKSFFRRAPDGEKALKEQMSSYAPDTPIVTYCGEGCQAGVVLLFQLKRLGFVNVRAMEEGFEEWRRRGYPVEAVQLEGGN